MSDSFVIPWTVAHQAPLFIGFSRQEYWSGLPCAPLEDLPDPGIDPTSLTSPALAGRFFAISTTWEAHWFPRTVFTKYHRVGAETTEFYSLTILEPESPK